jgi:hypothetical protein
MSGTFNKGRSESVREQRRSLDDFPLHAGEPDGVFEAPDRLGPSGRAGAVAPLGARWSAAAASRSSARAW